MMSESGTKNGYNNEGTSERQKSILNIMMHDLRTPLNSIIGFSGLAKELAQKHQDRDLSQYLNIVEDEAMSLMELITVFAQWYLDTDKKEEIRIGDIFNQAIATQANITIFKQLKIEVIKGLDMKIYADKNVINALLRNLIGNSIKYTPPGGLIQLSAEHHNEKMRISISDNGWGISSDKIKNIFKPSDSVNFANSQAGMGIGLYLCKKFIELEGGTIWVESFPDKGSTFHFTVPRCD